MQNIFVFYCQIEHSYLIIQEQELFQLIKECDVYTSQLT